MSDYQGWAMFVDCSFLLRYQRMRVMAQDSALWCLHHRSRCVIPPLHESLLSDSSRSPSWRLWWSVGAVTWLKLSVSTSNFFLDPRRLRRVGLSKLSTRVSVLQLFLLDRQWFTPSILCSRFSWMAAGVRSLVGNNRVKHGLMQRSFWELYPSDSASISFLEQLKNYAADSNISLIITLSLLWFFIVQFNLVWDSCLLFVDLFPFLYSKLPCFV